MIRCAIPAEADVAIERRISRTPCRHGRSWGVDRGGIWVKGGCRALFKVVTKANNYIPDWLYGRFHGYDRLNDEEISLVFRQDGVVRAKKHGRHVPAELDGDVLTLDGEHFEIAKTPRGFRAENTVSGGFRRIRFKRRH